eukprot:3101840-Ditylum_brightwellii.AAC.2
MLANDDEFVKAIAFKLGVSTDKIRCINRSVPLTPRPSETCAESSLGESRVDEGVGNNPCLEEITGSFNKAGDIDFCPQDYTDLFSLKCSLKTMQKEEEAEYSMTSEKTVHVPNFNISSPDFLTCTLEEHVGVKGYGWRKLPKAIIGADFFKLNKHKVQKCTEGNMFNQCSTSKIVGMVDPVSLLNFARSRSNRSIQRITFILFCTHI